MDKIVKQLKKEIAELLRRKENPFEKSWQYESGILLSINEAEKIVDALEHRLSEGEENVVGRSIVCQYCHKRFGYSDNGGDKVDCPYCGKPNDC
jgi:hypothetical protein